VLLLGDELDVTAQDGAAVVCVVGDKLSIGHRHATPIARREAPADCDPAIVHQ
jgi:hypothetical protein